MRRLGLFAVGAALLFVGACSKSESSGAASSTGGSGKSGSGTTAGGAAGAAGSATTGGAAGSATAGTGGTTSTGGTSSTGGSGGAPPSPPPCTLTLTKTVDLPAPKVMKTKVFGPGIVPTQTGFVIGYHEVASDGSDDRITAVPVAFDGTVGTVASEPVQACFGTYSKTGVGMAVRGGAGLATVMRPTCKDPSGDTGGSMSLVHFNSDASIQETFLFKGPAGFAELETPGPHTIAAVPGSQNYRVSYVQNGIAYGFDVTDVTPKSGFNALAGSAQDPVQSLAIASSANVLVEAVALKGGVVVKASGPMVTDGSKLFMVSLGAPIATAAVANGVVVAARTGPGSVLLHMVDEAGNLVAQATMPMIPVSSVDVTYLAKGVGVVVGDAGTLTVRASTLPSPDAPPGLTEMKSLSKTDHPTLATFDGKAFAAAGKSSTIAVAWLGSSDGEQGKPVGGVAVFECK